MAGKPSTAVKYQLKKIKHPSLIFKLKALKNLTFSTEERRVMRRLDSFILLPRLNVGAQGAGGELESLHKIIKSQIW